MNQIVVASASTKFGGALARVNKRSPTATDRAVGVKIRLLRRAAGITLRDLGEAVGVSCVQFQRYETGNSRLSASRLVAISNALGVRVDSLIVDPVPADPESLSHEERIECAEMARQFRAIRDRRHRLAIIELARAIAAQEQQARESVGGSHEGFLGTLGELNPEADQ